MIQQIKLLDLRTMDEFKQAFDKLSRKKLKLSNGVKKLVESGEKIKPKDLNKVFPKENED